MQKDCVESETEIGDNLHSISGVHGKLICFAIQRVVIVFPYCLFPLVMRIYLYLLAIFSWFSLILIFLMELIRDWFLENQHFFVRYHLIGCVSTTKYRTVLF